MDLVVNLAKSVDADITCANDPDADRFAVAVRTDDGSYKMLTGDQVGVLFAHYLLSKPHAKNQFVHVYLPGLAAQKAFGDLRVSQQCCPGVGKAVLASGQHMLFVQTSRSMSFSHCLEREKDS